MPVFCKNECYFISLTALDWLRPDHLQGKIFNPPFSHPGWDGPFSGTPKDPFRALVPPQGTPGGALLPQIFPKMGYVNHAH